MLHLGLPPKPVGPPNRCVMHWGRLPIAEHEKVGNPCAHLAHRPRRSWPRLARVRGWLRNYWRAQTRTGAARIREKALVAELLALVDEKVAYRRDELRATIAWAIPREDQWR